MLFSPPTHVEIVNISDKARTIYDAGLSERGGRITLQPGQSTVVPLVVFHRIGTNPFIVRMEKYNEMIANKEVKVTIEEKPVEKKHEAVKKEKKDG